MSDAKPDARIAVVVLTWNYREYTVECLASLRQQELPHTVYVVDNGSTDDTVEAVRTGFSEAHLVLNGENHGFAVGNNIGLQAAFEDGAEAVLVLNNDTTLAPDALRILRDAMRHHPDAGVLTPAILYAHPPFPVWFGGATVRPMVGMTFHEYHMAPHEQIPAGVRRTGRATGCAMLVTRACYERIGGFDPDFFMYVEDVEYSLRARGAGYETYLVPEAVVYHHVSASSSGVKATNAIYYGMRNALVTFDRHYPLPPPLRLVRHALSVGVMVLYVLKPPVAPRRLADVIAGYWDAARRRLGRRGAARNVSRRPVSAGR